MRPTVATPEVLARDHPEWGPWLALLAEAQRALNTPSWTRVGPEAGQPPASGSAPLLQEAVIGVEPRRADRFVRRLFEIAGTGGGPATALRSATRDDRLDALGLLEAAICQDAGRLDEQARRLGVESAVLGAVLAVAATPLLHACRRAWEDRLPAGWTNGWCPVCGAWPTLAEARGLERSRQLRCGRCGGDWRTDWLRCPYCGNGDHARLSSLVADAALQTRKVETCEMCRGYLKTLTTLQATPADALALVDLATIDLDVAALEHGYARPDEPACGLSARVVPALP